MAYGFTTITGRTALDVTSGDAIQMKSCPGSDDDTPAVDSLLLSLFSYRGLISVLDTIRDEVSMERPDIDIEFEPLVASRMIRL
jgi:hypothetical protein